MINSLYVNPYLYLFLYINLYKLTYKAHIIDSFKNKSKSIINVILTLIDIILTKNSLFSLGERLLDEHLLPHNY